LIYYSTNKHGCRNKNSKNDRKEIKTNAVNDVHHCSYTTMMWKKQNQRYLSSFLPLQNVLELQKHPKYIKLLVKIYK